VKMKLLASLLAVAGLLVGCAPDAAKFSLPTIPPEHKHARALAANAFRYTDPAHGLTDPVSGYPVEGWNQDPERGLYLRSFTQLTAIGEWVELLACIAAGQADNPYRTRAEALRDLEQVVTSLLADQADTTLSANGLLSNFIGFKGSRRVGPLTSRVRRADFLEEFGDELGTRIWNDLAEHGWIVHEKDGAEASVRRSATYGKKHFDGVMAAHADPERITAIMKLLDARVVKIIFGDNVNLTASVAKGMGALLDASLRDSTRATQVRESMERFIENQREGYRLLYDDESRSFGFGWDAAEKRFVGWESEDGHWTSGRMNYFVNEFRGGWMFVALRFGLPLDSIAAGSVVLKPCRLTDGTERYAPAAWDGSAFQILGLSLFMQELHTAGWGTLLRNAVAYELDYARRHDMPGLLSESYSGNGTEYTGAVGLPDVAVTKEERITDAPSLYTLGVAYQISPETVEAFLAEEWGVVKTLLTDHGPWEGLKVSTGEPIRFQTAAHTLSLLLGLIGTADLNMERYLAHHRLDGNLQDLYVSGASTDLLSDAFKGVGWSQGSDRFEVEHADGVFSVQGKGAAGPHLALLAQTEQGTNLSGTTLRLRYRSSAALPSCVMQIKPRQPRAIMNSVHLDIRNTGDGEQEIEIPLPETPALADVSELVFVLAPGEEAVNLDLVIRSFSVESGKGVNQTPPALAGGESDLSSLSVQTKI